MFSLFLALLPGRLHCAIRRGLGQSIHPTARLGIGVILRCPEITLGAGSIIGSFVRIRAQNFQLGERAHIASFVTITSFSVQIGSDSSIAAINFIAGDASLARSTFVMGSHSRIFPFCWLDPGHGISLGDRVGVGGHGLIFTHGSWANYFRGAPVGSGPVHIGDRVWLPWRVFIMPGVEIGEDAIIGAGSVVTKSIAPGALAAGVPAKELRANAYAPLSADALNVRMRLVVAEFLAEASDVQKNAVVVRETESTWGPPCPTVVVTGMIDPHRAATAAKSGTSVVDVVREMAWLASGDDLGPRLINWLTRYGVRVDVVGNCDVEDGPAHSRPSNKPARKREL